MRWLRRLLGRVSDAATSGGKPVDDRSIDDHITDEKQRLNPAHGTRMKADRDVVDPD